MSGTVNWHEDDAFWAAVGPFDFDAEHWARAPKEVDGALALLGVAPGAAILDLACGPGRHSLELARRAFRVTGVDRTAAFLAEAKKRAEEEGLPVELVREDMRTFVREGAFDGAISLFTSIAYFDDPEEDAKVFGNLHRSLKAGGSVVIDTLAKEVVARTFHERSWSERDGIMVLEERRIVRDWTGIESRWVILRGDRRQEIRFTLRLYSAAEMKAALRRAGFRSVEVFGDLAGGPFDQTARRLIAVARK